MKSFRQGLSAKVFILIVLGGHLVGCSKSEVEFDGNPAPASEYIVEINYFKTRCSPLVIQPPPGSVYYEQNQDCILIRELSPILKDWTINNRFPKRQFVTSSANKSIIVTSLEDQFIADHIVTVKVAANMHKMNCDQMADCVSEYITYVVTEVLKVERQTTNHTDAQLNLSGRFNITPLLSTLPNISQYSGFHVSLKVCRSNCDCPEVYSVLVPQTLNASSPVGAFDVELPIKLNRIFRDSDFLNVDVQPIYGGIDTTELSGSKFGGYMNLRDLKLHNMVNSLEMGWTCHTW